MAPQNTSTPHPSIDKDARVSTQKTGNLWSCRQQSERGAHNFGIDHYSETAHKPLATTPKHALLPRNMEPSSVQPGARACYRCLLGAVAHGDKHTRLPHKIHYVPHLARGKVDPESSSGVLGFTSLMLFELRWLFLLHPVLHSVL